MLDENVFLPLDRALKGLGRSLASELPGLGWQRTFADCARGLLAKHAGKRVLVMHDGVPKRLCLLKEEDLGSVLHSVGEVKELAPERGYPEPDRLASWEAAGRLAQELTQRSTPVDVVLAVGSGSLCDVVKHALHLLGTDSVVSLPRLCFLPTALTVTAFTSAFAVLEKAGHKSTQPSRQADEVWFVEEILAAAPQELTRSGVGDLLAGFVSYADWAFADVLGFSEEFQPQAAELMRQMHALLQKPPRQDAELGQVVLELPQNLQAVANTLCAAGLAMNWGASSSPQSGGEHAISHVVDFYRAISQRPKTPHGLQVAVGALASAALHEWVQSQDFFPLNRLCRISSAEMKGVVTRAFWESPFCGGREFLEPQNHEKWLEERGDVLSAACERFCAIAERKRVAWEGCAARYSQFQQAWEGRRGEVKALAVTESELLALMRLWGVPTVPEELPPAVTSQELRAALRFSPFFRERFGVQDFVFWQGEDPVVVAAI